MTKTDLSAIDHLKNELQVKALKGFKKIETMGEHYELGALLSKGAFGRVYRAKHVQMDTETAVKVVSKEKVGEQQIHAELMQNELEVLQEVSHPNIMRVIEVVEDEENYYIITEFISGGNLLDKLKEVGGSFTEVQTSSIIKQVLMAINYMHQTMQISHRDIKLENILCMPQKSPEDDL